MNEEINKEIKNCLDVLHRGGLILYPTDTIWGIGCDATNASAVSRIYQLKQREESKSMIILLDNEARLQSYVSQIPEAAWDLVELSEKPLTIIYDGAKNLASNVIANDGSIGIRITKDDFCRQLIQKFRKPLVSTSANISGNEPPARFSDIHDSIISGVDYVVNLRHDEVMKNPSTIIRIHQNGVFKIIRG